MRKKVRVTHKTIASKRCFHTHDDAKPRVHSKTGTVADPIFPENTLSKRKVRKK